MSLTLTTPPKRVRYLNNRDLMSEIHKSKLSFSSFTDDKYKQHDTIVSSVREIDNEVIARAKTNRAKRIGVEKFIALRNDGDKKTKFPECIPDIKSIKDTDVVIRVMTFEHIPLNPTRKKTKKTIADYHERVNFPPFQHWVMSETGDLVCVGKSHWKGSLHSGKFSIDHGRITENLGRMFLKLTDRYSSKANWRNYTYLDEMKSQSTLQLSKVGLQFNEHKSENPFAYFTTTISNSFTKIANSEKDQQNIRDDLLEDAGLTPSLSRQSSHEFADEIARQAKLYKNMKIEKSATTDIEDLIQDLSNVAEIANNVAITEEDHNEIDLAMVL